MCLFLCLSPARSPCPCPTQSLFGPPGSCRDRRRYCNLVRCNSKSKCNKWRCRRNCPLKCGRCGTAQSVGGRKSIPGYVVHGLLYYPSSIWIDALKKFPLDLRKYSLRNFASEAAAANAGFVVTHKGHCGACSTLQGDFTERFVYGNAGR